MTGVKEVVYPVHEFFYTWQGEGCFLGKAAFFIRLYGCPVHCPWCDSAGTWNKNYVPSHISKMTASNLLSQYLMATDLTEYDLTTLAPEAIPFVVLTGGEPAMFDLVPICQTFQSMGIRVHIETSGAFKLRDEGMLDWVTVSPKWNALPLKENIQLSNELKIIVEHKDSIKDWQTKIEEIWPGFVWTSSRTIWLHPEWSKARDRDRPTLDSITDAVKNRDGSFWIGMRAGYQLHKLYMADLLDPHASKELIPLGGDLTRGF